MKTILIANHVNSIYSDIITRAGGENYTYNDLGVQIQTSKQLVLINGRVLEGDNIKLYLLAQSKNFELAAVTSRIAEAAGIQLIDSLMSTDKLVFGKLIQMYLASTLGVRIPTTYAAKKYTDADFDFISKIYQGKPFIFKSTTAGVGKDNYLIRDPQEILVIQKENPSTLFIAQEFIPNRFDYRIMVLDGKVAGVYKRQRTGDSHRNNAALGGQVTKMDIAQLDRAMVADAERIAQAAHIGIAGVDMLIDEEGKHWFLEINKMPSVGFFEGFEEVLLDYFCR